MPRPEYSCSIPTKFDLQTLKQLRQSALRNQRSVSGEIRFRILQTIKPEDSDKNQAEMTTVINKKQSIGGYDGK